jgi:hypothetical protein
MNERYALASPSLPVMRLSESPTSKPHRPHDRTKCLNGT